jgi:O-antigen ligase
MNEDFALRAQMYENAKPMAADYPWFGTGPGTFENVFQYYRISPESVWPAQLHNDWLEMRITFGWVGGALLGLALAMVLFGSFARQATSGVAGLIPFIWMAMAGVLVHARFDFPFRVHSIAFLFLLLSAILFVANRRSMGSVA